MPEPQVVRRLAAVFVADAVGYSRLMGVDEVGTHIQVKKDLDELLKPKVREYHGHIVKTTGDGLLAMFDSVVEAVDCAACIQRAFDGRNADLLDERLLAYRIGINLGDIIVERDDIYGDDVNLAVRVQALAEPGGIVVSGPVYDNVHQKVPLEFEDLGEHSLKNIPRPVRVYRVLKGRERQSTKGERGVVETPSATQPAAADASRPGGGAAKPSLIVLPFDNLNRDAAMESFCDGLMSDITTDLSKFSNLSVVAANTAFAFKGPAVNMTRVRVELGVRYIVEGSVQRSAEGARINVQLIDAASGHHLWAERYAERGETLLARQDEMLRKIVVALAFRILTLEQKRVMAKDVSALDAYELWLTGLHCYSNETRAALEQSSRLFRRATELDPGFTPAWAFLAYSLVHASLAGWGEPDGFERARDYANRAVALDASDHLTHWALATVYLHSKRLEQAIEEFETAVRLNPHDPSVLAEMAEALCYAGQASRGVAIIKEVIAMSPFCKDWYRWDLAWGYYLLGAFEKAMAELDAILKPANDMRLLMAATAAQLGDEKRAVREMARFRAVRPEWVVAMERESVPFQRAEDEARWIEGVRKAGLPEA